MKLYTKAEIKEKDGEIVGIASTAVEDRHGEVVEVDGWDFKNFKKDPVMLWAHDHSQPAIGSVSKIWIEGEGKKRRLMFKAVFQEVTELGKAIKQLVEDGFLRTFSVGFKPLEIDGNTIMKQELLEISVVNVPANPEAMMLAYKSLKEHGFDSQTISDAGMPVAVLDELESVKSEATQAKELAELAVKGLEHLNPQRSKREVVTKRLNWSKVVAKASDQMLTGKLTKDKTVLNAKIIKRSSEMLIRDLKGDL